MTSRRFGLWWQMARRWFEKKFSEIRVDIDTGELAQESTSQQILAAVENIDIDTSDLAKQGTNPNATLSAILEALQGSGTPSPDIPEGVAERLAMILEHFGIKTISGYSFGTPTEIIDELKDIMGAIDQEATLPNSVTIDGTTYSGTSNS